LVSTESGNPRSGAVDRLGDPLLRKYYHAEGVQRAWWPARKNGYSPESQRFLSETKPPEELSTLTKLFG